MQLSRTNFHGMQLTQANLQPAQPNLVLIWLSLQLPSLRASQVMDGSSAHSAGTRQVKHRKGGGLTITCASKEGSGVPEGGALESTRRQPAPRGVGVQVAKPRDRRPQAAAAR